MEDWFEILIFVIVIIANIFGVIIKAKKKREAQELGLPPDTAEDEEYFEEEFPEDEYPEEKYFSSQIQSAPAIQNAPSPAVSAPVPSTVDNAPQNIEVVDIDEDADERFDYGEFMRTHGREAFVLAEMILPANSRQGQ